MLARGWDPEAEDDGVVADDEEEGDDSDGEGAPEVVEAIVREGA